MSAFLAYAIDHLGGVSLIVTFLMGVLAVLYRSHVEQRLARIQASFAQQLAQAAGDIRQRVESSLKEQESRLRVIAEVHLRVHARQLEDLSACRWKATRARLGVDRFLFQHHRGASAQGLGPMPSVEEAIADAMGAAVLVPPRHRAPILAYVDYMREVVYSVDEAVSEHRQADAAKLHAELGEAERRAVTAFDAWLEELTTAHESVLARLGAGASPAT